MPPAPPAAEAPDAAHPVRAVLTRTADGIRIQILGESARPLRVGYRLVARANGNTADQSGAATLEPGRPTRLLDLTQNAGDDWSARLDVFVDSHLAYSVPLRRP